MLYNFSGQVLQEDSSPPLVKNVVLSHEGEESNREESSKECGGN